MWQCPYMGGLLVQLPGFALSIIYTSPMCSFVIFAMELSAVYTHRKIPVWILLNNSKLDGIYPIDLEPNEIQFGSKSTREW